MFLDVLRIQVRKLCSLKTFASASIQLYYHTLPLKVQAYFKMLVAAFRALLDNYESGTEKPEVVTPQEEQENRRFIDAIMETSVMQELHRVLASRNFAPEDVGQFKHQLYDIWFRLYRRLHEDK